MPPIPKPWRNSNSAVFGWNVRHIPEFNYWMFDTGAGDGINGGMVKRMGDKPAGDCPVSAFVCSLGVASVDNALAAALDNGATIALPKMAIPASAIRPTSRIRMATSLACTKPIRTRSKAQGRAALACAAIGFTGSAFSPDCVMSTR